MRRTTAVLVGLSFGVAPASASAQTAGNSVTSFGIGEWLSLMLRLGLVIAVIWAAVYAMRWYTQRAGRGRPVAARALDIVETRSLGPNRALHLVRIGGRAVLIGVTPERISALLEIDDPDMLDGLDTASGGTSFPVTAFGGLLAGFGDGSKHASRESSEAVRRTTSTVGGLRGVASPILSYWSRLLLDRVLAILGFTPVEQGAPTGGGMPVAGRAMHMASRSEAAPSTIPTPRGATPSLPAPPASATQGLRARSGYQASQQSSQVGPDPSDRDARIAAAQHAIADAWQRAG
jgi:flagellar biosynthetic protein FliO